jgi:DNA-directed RNA polymerase specialized sigma24 family protein
MRAAHRIAGFTLTEIAAEAGISAARVGQLVARAEKVK